MPRRPTRAIHGAAAALLAASLAACDMPEATSQSQPTSNEAPSPIDPSVAPGLREIPFAEYADRRTTVSVDLNMAEIPGWYRIEGSFEGERWSKGREPRIRVYRIEDGASIDSVRFQDDSNREDGMRVVAAPGGLLGYRDLLAISEGMFVDLQIDGSWVPNSRGAMEAIGRLVDKLQEFDRRVN
jgi:hypothetical protein